MGEQSFELPRLMIAAPHGKSGKTVLTTGLLRALKDRGLSVQPFKKGPDYIDPGWHAVACGSRSRNLDSCFMDAPTMRRVLRDASVGADLALIEGAHGLFDGSDAAGTSSSAEVAKRTATPVVLVVDTTRMTRTTAAVVLGCMHLDPDVTLAGVILNRVHGPRHENTIRTSIERYCGVPVLGAVPKDERLLLPDRHLGLVSSVEVGTADSFVSGVADVLGEHIDFEALLAVASSAPALTCPSEPLFASLRIDARDKERVKIAVVRDRAFNFYYEENLHALEAAGADLVFVDSMNDLGLPDDIDGFYVGGGFPEVFASQLQANVSFRTSVKRAIEAGVAGYAECGGLMYLTRTMHTDEGAFSMVGAFDAEVRMERNRQGHGYANVVARDEHPWFAAGTKVVGHEHHHSKVTVAKGECSFAFDNQRGRGIEDAKDGLCLNRTVAGYTHVNAIASPVWASGFVEAARAYKAERRKSREPRMLEPFFVLKRA